MRITSRQLVCSEDKEYGTTIIRPGALEFDLKQVTVQWNMHYDQDPLGFAHDFERIDDDIWATIDWKQDASDQFFNPDGSWRSELFDLSIYAIECKFSSNDQGRFVLSYGKVRAVSVIPLPGFPRGGIYVPTQNRRV